MMPELFFKTKVELECLVIHAEIAIAEKMHYLLPVLAHVDERKDSTVDTLSEELFLKRPHGATLLDMAADYGLIKENSGTYSLSGDGRTALEEKTVFVTDNNKMWKIYRAVHPLIDGAHEVLKLDRDWGGQATFKPHNSGELTGFQIQENQTMASVVGDSARFRIKKYSEKAKSFEPEIDAYLHWSLDESGSSLTLETIPRASEQSLHSDSEEEKSPLPFQGAGHAEVWEKLLLDEGISGWDDARESLEVSFDDASAEQLISMKKILAFDDPEPPRADDCRFDRLEVTVDIHPDEGSVQKWAEYLLVDGIHDYLTQDMYEKLARDVREKLSGFKMSFGDRGGCLSGIRNPDRSKFWYVQAAEDWEI